MKAQLPDGGPCLEVNRNPGRPHHEPRALLETIMPGAPNAAGPYAPQDTYSKAETLTDRFDLLTHQAQSELDNTTQSIFFFGDGLQRALTDGFFDLFSPKTWTPANILRLSSETV